MPHLELYLRVKKCFKAFFLSWVFENTDCPLMIPAIAKRVCYQMSKIPNRENRFDNQQPIIDDDLTVA